jgi:hypothetical protein
MKVMPVSLAPVSIRIGQFSNFPCRLGSYEASLFSIFVHHPATKSWDDEVLQTNILPLYFSNKYLRRSKHSDSSSMRSNSGFQSSVHDKYRSNAQAYDKSLLQKLDARRGSDNTTPPRSFSKPILSSSANDTSPTQRSAFEQRHPVQLKPLSLPINTSRPILADSPLARWTETPATMSPRNPYSRFGMQGGHDFRSSTDTIESERSPLPFTRRSISGSVMSMADDASITNRSRETYDQRVSPDQDADFQMEETGLRRLHIDDFHGRADPGYSPGLTAGQKRRASSPPGDDGPSLHTVGSQSDLYRRRESASRMSPSPRYHSTSGSVSSTTSGPRSNSYASSLSIGGSSITSMGSYGRLSPGGISPVPTDGSDSPYVTSVSLDPSPRGALSRPTHSRTLSETRPIMTSRKLSDSMIHTQHSSGPKIQGVFICECCPKKPKKFDSQDELRYTTLSQLDFLEASDTII